MLEASTKTDLTGTSEALALSIRGGDFAVLLNRVVVTDPEGKAADIEDGLETAVTMLAGTRGGGNSAFLIGNGGSAAVAAHIANDLVNVAGLRATTLHDSSLLTCMANDYGYENAFARIVTTICRPGDVLIAISSSGNSANITNAVAAARKAGGSLITLSGFRAENPLRVLGDLNVWVPMADYGMVEIAHLFILHNLADRLRSRRETKD